MGRLPIAIKNTSWWYWEDRKEVFRRDFQHKKRKEERGKDPRRHIGGIFFPEESVPRYVCCRLLHPHYFLVMLKSLLDLEFHLDA